MKRFVISYIKNSKDRMYYAVKKGHIPYYDTKNIRLIGITQYLCHMLLITKKS